MYLAGDFVIQLITTGQDFKGGYQGPRLVVIQAAQPGKWLWHTRRGEAFVAAAQGQETIQEQRGSYTIRDHLTRRCTDQTIEQIQQAEGSVEVRGTLRCSGGSSTGYTLTFTAQSPGSLGFSLSFDDPQLNRAYLTYASDSDEAFFGFGEQFSYFDHKGQRVPIWVSEQGIGRGLQPLTFLVDRVARSGGNALHDLRGRPALHHSPPALALPRKQQYAVFDLRQARARSGAGVRAAACAGAS